MAPRHPRGFRINSARAFQLVLELTRFGGHLMLGTAKSCLLKIGHDVSGWQPRWSTGGCTGVPPFVWLWHGLMLLANGSG